MGEVGVHLGDQPGAAGQRLREAGDVGGAEPLLARRGAEPRRRRARRRAGRRSRRSRRATRRRRSAAGARPAGARARRQRSRRGCPPRYRSAGRARPSRALHPRHQGNRQHCQLESDRWPTDAKRRDRRGADRARNALRARRGQPLSRDRLQGGGARDPPEPGLGRRAGDRRQGQGPARESATPCRRRSSPWSETGEIPAAAKLKAKFPPSLVEVTRIPGLGAKTVRKLYDELGVSQPRRAARGGRGPADPRDQGPRPEGRGERPRVAREARRGGPEGAPAALRGPPGRRGARRGAARAPGVRRGRGRRIGPAAGRDLQGHRPDRHRDRPEGARRGADRARARRDRTGRPAPRGRKVVTHNGVSVDLRIVAPDAYGNLLQHFTGSAQHNIDLRERAVKQGLSVSEHGILETESGRRRQVRDRGRGLRAPRARLHRAGAARGQRRDRGGGRRRAARAGRARRHPRRPALPHDPLRRAQLARGDGRGGEASAATPTSRSPTTRPATGSATTSPRTMLEARIDEIAAYNDGEQGPLHAARRLGGQHPPRRLARLRARSCSSGSTGSSPASTPRSGSRRRR